MKKCLIYQMAAISLLTSINVFAESSSASIEVTLTIPHSCVMEQPYNSGFDSLESSQLQVATFIFPVACTRNTPFTVSLRSQNGGILQGQQQGLLKGAGQKMSYTLQQQATQSSYTQNEDGSFSAAGQGLDSFLPLNLLATVDFSGALAGAYTDTLVATISY